MPTYVDDIINSWSDTDGITTSPNNWRTWNGLGMPATIYYSFDPTKKFKSANALFTQDGTQLTYGVNGHYALDDGSNGTYDQQDAVSLAFTAWSTVAKLTFTPNDNAPGLVFYQATTPTSDDGGINWQQGSNNHLVNDDVALTQNNGPVGIGDHGFETIMHEIGHALGLNHPLNDGRANGYNRDLTIMSYRDGAVVANQPLGGINRNAITPMIYDIAAIQALYGANRNDVSGTYALHSGLNQASTLWDAGGTDIIILDDSANPNSTLGGTIDLRGGVDANGNPYWSHYGNDYMDIAFDPTNASGVVDIENATGGNGNDTIIGNSLNNVLIGGGGIDTITGGAGNDTLDGGIGQDTLIGGADTDTYLLHSTNSGLTTIRDDTGILKLDNSVFSGYAIRNTGGSWTIGNYYAAFLTGTNTLRLTNQNGANAFNLENFQNGDYGITLKENNGTPGGSGVGGNPPVQGDDATASGYSNPTHAWLEFTYSFQDKTYTSGPGGLNTNTTMADFYNNYLTDPANKSITDLTHYNIGDYQLVTPIQASAQSGYNDYTYGYPAPVATSITYVALKQTLANIVTTQGFAPPPAVTISETVTGNQASGIATHDATYWYYIDNWSGNAELPNFADLNSDGVDDRGALADAGIIGTAADDLLFSTDANDIFAGGAGYDTAFFSDNFGQDLLSEVERIVINGSGIQGAIYAHDASGNNFLSAYETTGATPGYVTYNARQETAGLVLSKAVYDSSGMVLVPQANTVTLTDYSPTQTYGITGIAFTVNGTSGDDVLIGGTAGDTIFGLAGNDTISGDTGNDTLYGGDGDDVIDGGLGADIIDGGAGNNTVTYAAPYDAVSVNLTTNVNSGGYATGDSLVNIQNVIGSMYNDTIVGNTTDNILTGGGGVDTLKGMGGEDTYRLSTTDSVTTIYNGLDSNAGTSGTLSEAFASDHLWFAQTGDDLTISVLGTYKNAVIKDWYAGSATSWQQLDEVIGSDNLKIDASIQTLVQAMATFGASNSGFTSPSTTHTSVTDSSYYGAVATAYANAWHA